MKREISSLSTLEKLTAFTSPDYSLVMAQIVFVAMAFSLVQLYISSKKLQNLAHRTMQTWRARELMGVDAVIVYYKNNFAIFDLIDYQAILLSLKEESRKRLYRKTLHLRRRRSPPKYNLKVNKLTNSRG